MDMAYSSTKEVYARFRARQNTKHVERQRSENVNKQP